ncbi:MAG: TonB-dependent receptor [Bacteroidales bacterium]|nr:TonB-dependent receptor [Candidatus Cacconaster merdequi]
MKGRFFKFIVLVLTSVLPLAAFAQTFSVKIKLQDSKSGEPVAYAAVSLTKAGETDVLKYGQTDADGAVTISGIPQGKYKVQGILLGYENYEETITVSKNLDLGIKQMKVQANFLEGAVVSDVGNPIIVKKDTIEHNVTLLKMADNDVLEDVLKKLPGVEVDSDGKITANGKTINKIYVDGKQFFLDDPNLASKNLPAKIIEKVRVVEKKSEQAEFTGIDDGEEETVLDLGIRKGMMNGWFGNMMAGGGRDLREVGNDGRYQGAALIGRFSENDQLAFVGNANNTNNRGFEDLAASSMGGMRVGGMRGGNRGGFGGGNNGISSSYLVGVNGGYSFDNKSEVMGNALFNGNERFVEESTARRTFKEDGSSLFATESSTSRTNTYGVRAAARADWKISKTASLLFEPNFNYGWGSFDEKNDFNTQSTLIDGSVQKVNDGYSESTGNNTSQNASGRLLWRQRLGKPGRTISVNMRYQFSNTDLDGFNKSTTNVFDAEHQSDPASVNPVDQMYDRNSRSQTVNGRLSYTEPLGHNFYMEGNYSYSFKKSTSDKSTYNKDNAGKYTILDNEYSSDITNNFTDQSMGLNLRKQEDKYNFTVGANFQPSKTENHTVQGTAKRDTTLKVYNWSPNARLDINFSDNEMLRFNYRGRTSQPSINQMMPIPDNSDPQKVTLGNLGLKPSFSHNVNVMYRTTSMKNFSSLNVNANFSYTTNGIVNASWYDKSGVQYTLPVNNKQGSKSAGANIMYNTPIGKSKFSIMSFTNANYSTGVSFVGKDVIESDDPQSYLDIKNYSENRYQNLSVSQNLRITFRDNIFEASVSGRTRYSQAWYSVSEKNVNPTWTSSVNADVTLNSDIVGFKTDARYTFYNGYGAGYNTPAFVWNAEISKQLFKKQFTLAIKAYDILNQSKNTYRTMTDNYVLDTRNNTLGRYVVMSLTYRFGKFGGGRGNGGPGGRGPMGPPPGGPRMRR